jgi:hypothetical protein
MILFAAFAGVALLLAALGIYGVASFSVTSALVKLPCALNNAETGLTLSETEICESKPRSTGASLHSV